jgi:acyl carrier protein
MKKTNEEIMQEIIALLTQIADVEKDVFQPDNSMWDSLDSLMGLELSVKIDRNYGVRLTKEDLTTCNTPRQLAVLIHSKLN